MKCIIPAAGYGIRSNAKLGESKEMLPDPHNKHYPLIKWSLDICKAFNMEPLVITRENKKDLRQYLFNEGIKFIDIEVEGEWNQSILKSKDHWDENNLLLLPDTRFDTLRCVQDIQRGLELGNNAVMALHRVTNPSEWGIVDNYKIYEKPQSYMFDKPMAWGLIGFKDTYGQELFSNINSLELRNVGFTFLNKFEDLTRNK